MQVLKNEDKMKNSVATTNYPIRSIIREGNKDLTEEAACKSRSQSSLSQMLNRKRAQKSEAVQPYDTPLCDLYIPDSLHYTYLNQLFYWDDSSRADPTRVIVFTTENNLRLLQQNRDWLADGTFDLAPKRVFNQVYSIHIIYKNKSLPMIYGLLPNKSQATYRKFFKMIKDVIKIEPLAIHMDFEKAVMNSVSITFKCLIYGCFFHLSQNFYKKVQEKNLIDYAQEDEFRLYYKLMQALAFLPEEHVIEGFLLLKEASPIKFTPILDYLETYYIGKLIEFSRTIRVIPTFPIPTWNLYQRVKDDKPRVTNSVEAWHQVMTPDIKANMDIESLVEIFRKEQGQTDTWVAQLSTGMEHKKRKESIEYNRRLKLIVLDYNENDKFTYMKKIAFILS